MRPPLPFPVTTVHEGLVESHDFPYHQMVTKVSPSPSTNSVHYWEALMVLLLLPAGVLIAEIYGRPELTLAQEY